MGKRSNFERVERDFYPTPYAAVLPLLTHLKDVQYFIEPCAGDGTLVDHLETAGFECCWKSDIEPQRNDIRKMNALNSKFRFKIPWGENSPIITNPPWDRKILHPMIEHFSTQLPTWLLFDADWIHTKQSIPYMKWCRKIVSVGRVKWIPDSKTTGKDNACWYLFDQRNLPISTKFYPRVNSIDNKLKT